MEAGTVFQESGTWPGTQRRAREALAHGLQQRGDYELNLGARVVPPTDLTPAWVSMTWEPQPGAPERITVQLTLR
jgi:hypothetical protein